MENQTAISTKWAIDTMHSEVSFKVKHLVISSVTGTFNKFEGTLESHNDDFNDAQIHFSIDADSIDTNQSDRDGHLKSDDFFSVATYPKINFTSTSFKKVSDKEFKLTGKLTIKDVTKEVELIAEYGGSATDAYGNHKAGFEVTGKINRKDFGLTWSSLTEAGAIVVGEEIKLSINVQVSKQA